MLDFKDIVPHSHAQVKDMFLYGSMGSQFEDFDDFQVLVTRGIVIDNDALGFEALSFLICRDGIYLGDASNLGFYVLEGGWPDVYKHLHGMYRKNRRILDSVLSHIDDLENQVFSRKVSGLFMDHWVSLKSDLSNLDSYYFRNSSVFREFVSICGPKMGKLKNKFEDIGETIGYQRSSVDSLKSQLDGVGQYHASLRSERLNKTLLGLTVVSGVFLPLNLIVGFFGMNTPNLFLAGDPDGTKIVLFILIGVLMALALGFKAIDILDRFVFRYFLSKFDLYKSLKSRLVEVSEQLKGK